MNLPGRKYPTFGPSPLSWRDLQPTRGCPRHLPLAVTGDRAKVASPNCRVSGGLNVMLFVPWLFGLRPFLDGLNRAGEARGLRRGDLAQRPGFYKFVKSAIGNVKFHHPSKTRGAKKDGEEKKNH